MITVSRTLSCFDYHTAGEPFRIVVGGVGPIPGTTMMEKTVHVRDHMDALRRQILLEPRGHGAMCGAIVTEPTAKGADVGVLFLEPLGPVYMCGHGTIALATWLVETGRVPVSDGGAEVTLDTAAGLVTARARVEARRVVEVAFENVPAFSYRRGLVVEAEGLPPVTVDLAYGGHFYAIVEAAQLDLPLTPEACPRLIDAGERIRLRMEATIPLEHPERPGFAELLYVQWTGPAAGPGAHRRNVVIVAPRAVDRSPCGTGTSARMADLHAKGLLAVGEPFVHESVVGTRFRGRLLREVSLNGVRAVVPEVAGRAHLVAINTLVVDPDDPLQDGFLI
ncbi:MAG TPA: proline racemase family protein [Thermodesulfobacteriota bacterium]